MEFGRSLASRSGFLLPTAAVTLSSVMLGTASREALGEEAVMLVVRFVSAALAAASIWVGYRIATARVRVSSDIVTVRNVFSERKVSRASVVGVVSPDETPTQWLPMLQLRDGSKVKMFALARFKNRLWGPDRGSMELLEHLAASLEVPLQRPKNGGRAFGWG